MRYCICVVCSVHSLFTFLLLSSHNTLLTVLPRLIVHCADVYNGDVDDTSSCHAFSSSLYEAVLLQQHYIPEISLMAQSLEKDPDCTSSSRTSRKNSAFDIQKLTSHNYQSLIEESLKGSKGSAPLAFAPPKKLFTQENIIGQCFGSSP